MRILSKGTPGSDVRTLQAYLNLIQDGIFCNETKVFIYITNAK